MPNSTKQAAAKPTATPTAATSATQARKGGPPKGSTNAIRHGLASNLRHGMQGNSVPKGCRYIELRVNNLRRQVEEAVIAAKGEINLLDASLVNSVLKWEKHGMLAAHWLRTQIDQLSPSDRLKFSEAIAKASDNRDKAIRALQLDRDTKDNVFDALYSRALPAPESTEGE